MWSKASVLSPSGDERRSFAVSGARNRMSVPSGTPGAEAPGPMDAMLVGPVSVPEGSPEALLFAAGSESPEVEQPTDEASAQVPPNEAPVAASDDTGTAPEVIAEPVEAEAAPTIASVDTPDPEDEADLLTYPEAVRERFKKLPRADRRAFWEHTSAAAAVEVQAANERAAEVQRTQDERDAQARVIQESQGKFVGYVPIDLPDGQGGTLKGPTYEELHDALGSLPGRTMLQQKYGLTEERAEAIRDEMRDRRAMLASTADHMAKEAWGQTAFRFKNGLVALVGSEAEANAIVDGAGGPEGVLARLGERHQREIAAVEDRHQRERQVERKNYQDRIDALAENQDGMRGRVLAATTRDPATGGRSAGGVSGELTLEAYQRMSPEEAAKVPRSEIDRLTSRHVRLPH